jgi:hypothetical protein
MCCPSAKGTAANKWAVLVEKRCGKVLLFGESHMAERILNDAKASYQAWSVDQLAKSEFFHQKLHEWKLIEVAHLIEQVKGEMFPWNLADLGIAQPAWDKVVHRGIKPVIIFAHPDLLCQIPRSVGYYRMLAMVSQKSMNRVRLPVTRFEENDILPDREKAEAIAFHLNQIISNLVQADDMVDAREFDLWRGMAAGSQAQGSWQNAKGSLAELEIKRVLRQYLRDRGFVVEENITRLLLRDGREVIFADEPDIAVYVGNEIQVAVEVKGGIDTAAILERVGASIKSLQRAKEENPHSVTILLIQGVSLTQQAMVDLEMSRIVVNHWYTIEEFLGDMTKQGEVLRLLGV